MKNIRSFRAQENHFSLPLCPPALMRQGQMLATKSFHSCHYRGFKRANVSDVPIQIRLRFFVMQRELRESRVLAACE